VPFCHRCLHATTSLHCESRTTSPFPRAHLRDRRRRHRHLNPQGLKTGKRFIHAIIMTNFLLYPFRIKFTRRETLPCLLIMHSSKLTS